MKPVIREYLASLRERGELDAILPDLLSELGYIVFSRPSRGTRQFGVDVAAVGPPGDDRLHLFSIKKGGLTRSEWNGESEQALRPSLDEIFDAYIPNHLPPEHSGRRIVICPCFGGEVTEAAHEAFYGYIKTRSTERVEFSVWNGDRLAGHLENGLLREGLLTVGMRSHLRKAIAMSDETDASFSHFAGLVEALVTEAREAGDTKVLTTVRQLSISLWMLFVWAREQGNLESSYLASEYALLRAWELACGSLASGTRTAEDIGLVLSELIDLHGQVWTELVGKKVLPHVSKRHALSAAVRTASPLDVNLKLFDIAGRIAQQGLWLVWADARSAELPGPPPSRGRDRRIGNLADDLCDLVVANPVLFSPIKDEQVVDLSLCFLFLAAAGTRWEDLKAWISEIARRADFSFRRGGRYPCTRRGYDDLAEHPRDDEEYFKEATAGSVLLPTLAFWAAALDDRDTLARLSKLKSEVLPHCACQLWVPDEDSEPGIWRAQHGHGGAFLNIPVPPEPQIVLDYVLRECASDSPFHSLSAVKQGLWPLVLLACRHYRLPIPPHFWVGIMPWVSEPAKLGLIFELTGRNRKALATTTALALSMTASDATARSEARRQAA